MNNELHFAIIGCGNIAETHIKCIQESSHASLKSVYSRKQKKAEEWGRLYNTDYYSDYGKLLEDKQLDVVVILTPSGTHTELGILAAQAGKHVIVEKPLDTTLHKAKQLIEACRKANVVLSCIL